jgi:hypothetical protein
MPSVPRTNGSFENSAGRSGLSEPLARQLLDPRHVLGREVGPQLDHHAAGLEVHVEHVLEILTVGAAREHHGEEDAAEHAYDPMHGRWLLRGHGLPAAVRCWLSTRFGAAGQARMC